MDKTESGIVTRRSIEDRSRRCRRGSSHRLENRSRSSAKAFRTQTHWFLVVLTFLDSMFRKRWRLLLLCNFYSCALLYYGPSHRRDNRSKSCIGVEVVVENENEILSKKPIGNRKTPSKKYRKTGSKSFETINCCLGILTVFSDIS